MKRIATLIVMIALAAASQAQTQPAQIETFPQGKAATQSYMPRFIGNSGDTVFFVEASGRMKNKLDLVAYTMEQQELARIRLTDDKEVNCYGGYVNGGFVDLLMTHQADHAMRVYRDRRDVRTLQPAGDALVLADHNGKNEQYGFTIATSANGELLAGIFVTAQQGMKPDIRVGLYSRELEEYWKMSANATAVKNIFVSDSGEVLLGSVGDKAYNVEVLDGEKSNSYRIKTEATIIGESTIARYAKGNIYIVAANSKHDNNYFGLRTDHIYCICYDTRRNISSVDRHYFDKVEYNRLNNLKDDQKVKHDDFCMFFLSINQSLPDANGCYVMIDQTWTVRVDGTPSTQNRNGMMVARIDDDGRFRWVNTFRISNITKWATKQQAGYRWERTAKGPMLIWTETKSKNEIPEGTPVKDFHANNNAGMLSVMLIDANGNSERQHFDIPSKQALLGHPYRIGNDEFLLIVRGTSRGHFAKLTMQH